MFTAYLLRSPISIQELTEADDLTSAMVGLQGLLAPHLAFGLHSETLPVTIGVRTITLPLNHHRITMI